MSSFQINNCVVLMPFGSTLFGTRTKNSDSDYISVSMPKLNDLLLCKSKDSINYTTGNNNEKNNKNDIDCTIYSIHKFIEMASKNITIAMDMLHAPNSLIIYQNAIWRRIIENRTMFYSKHFTSYMGYINSQCYKYNIKGNKLEELSNLISFFSKYPNNRKLIDIWNEIPESKYCKKICITNNIDMLDILDQKYDRKIKVSVLLDSLQRKYDSYGHRAKTCMENNGIDWKAISHAVRFSIQLLDLYNDGFMTLPLKEKDRNLILSIKTGQIEFDKISDILQENINEINILSEKSDFPDYVDINLCQTLLQDICHEYYIERKIETMNFEVSNEGTKQSCSETI